jgi:3D (Asp-Asp-Asp) domain-containing protein
MKTLTLNAVVVLAAAGLMASCSSLDDSPSTGLRLLSKDRAMARSGGSGFYPHPASVSLQTASDHLPKDRYGMPTYADAGQRKRYVRTTSYSHMENEVGAPGRMNAAGTVLKYGAVRSAGADWSRYPVGTTFKIKGLPYTYVVDDYGSSLVGTNTIDIFHPTLGSMKAWATRPVEIQVVRWGSMERTVNLLKGRTRHAHCARMYYAARRQLATGSYASTAKAKSPSL